MNKTNNWKTCPVCKDRFDYKSENQRCCSKECRKALDKILVQRQAERDKIRRRQKRCQRCGEWLEKDQFPDGTGDQKLTSCINCMPFTVAMREKNHNVCGYFDQTLKDGEVRQEFVPTCPLYDNCMERALRWNMSPACFAPDRMELDGFLSLDMAEKRRVEMLFSRKLDGEWEVVEDSIWNYFDYYGVSRADVMGEEKVYRMVPERLVLAPVYGGD